MKTPVVVVALTLTAAILVAVVMLAGTRKSAGTSTWRVPAGQVRVSA